MEFVGKLVKSCIPPGAYVSAVYRELFQAVESPTVSLLEAHHNVGTLERQVERLDGFQACSVPFRKLAYTGQAEFTNVESGDSISGALHPGFALLCHLPVFDVALMERKVAPERDNVY